MLGTGAFEDHGVLIGLHAEGDSPVQLIRIINIDIIVCDYDKFNFGDGKQGGDGIFALYLDEIDLFARDFAEAWQQRARQLSR